VDKELTQKLTAVEYLVQGVVTITLKTLVWD